jgi:hypothetical protein
LGGIQNTHWHSHHRRKRRRQRVKEIWMPVRTCWMCSIHGTIIDNESLANEKILNWTHMVGNAVSLFQMLMTFQLYLADHIIFKILNLLNTPAICD